MTIEIPAEALDDVNNALSHTAPRDDRNGVFLVGHIRKLAAFANHFASRPLPGMQVEHLVGAESVIHITDDSFGNVDVVKVNGQTFTPEMPSAGSMVIPNATDLYRRMLAECAVRFREYASIHRAKAKVATNLSHYSSEAERRAKYEQSTENAESDASIASRIETLLNGLDEPAPKDEEELRFQRFVERVAGFKDEEIPKVSAWQFRAIARCVVEGMAPEYPDFSHVPPPELPADVRALVIAGRKVRLASDDRFEEWDELDKALEAFSSRVPYDDEPEDSGMVASNEGVTDFDLSASMGERFVFGSPPEGWGESIAEPVPSWVYQEPRVMPTIGSFSYSGPMREEFTGEEMGRDWMVVRAFRLPVDHPYYIATSRGFTYWPGGDEAPSDLDAIREILIEDGETGWADFCHRTAWAKEPGVGKIRVIGYHKLPAAETITLSTQAATIGEGATVKPEDAASLETDVSFGDKIRNTFEDRMRAQKIDAFAISASEDDIAAFVNRGWGDKRKARIKARYDFAFDMMAERENRGLK